MKKISLAISMIALITVLIFGGYTWTEAASKKGPQYGGILKIITNEVAPPNFGIPMKSGPRGGPHRVGTYEWLLTCDADRVVKPWLATDWKLASDGKSYILKLREGVKFHDGTDFNAEAVKYNLELSKKLSPSRVAGLIGVDVVDKYTVQLNLPEFNNAFLGNLTKEMGLMISPTAIETKGMKWVGTHPVGTGPFKLVSYEKDVHVKYTKFDDYWDKGKPYLDGLEWYTIKDPVTAVASLEVGDAQILHLPPDQYNAGLEAKGFKVISARGGIVALSGDTANPDSIYANKKVREAVEYAIDKEGIAKALGYGYWIPTNQVCVSGSFAYNTDYKGRTYDPDKAKQLLAEAGYPDGFDTRIIIREAARKDTGIAIQGSLRKVGINVKVDVADRARWSKHKYEGWNNALMYTLVTSGDVDACLVRHFGEGSRDYKVSLARTPGLVETLSKAIIEKDRASQVALAKKAVRLMAEDAMLIPLWSRTSSMVMHRSVHDLGYGESNMQHFYPGNAWLSK